MLDEATYDDVQQGPFAKGKVGTSVDRSVALKNTVQSYKTLGEIAKMSAEFRVGTKRIMMGQELPAAGVKTLPILQFITQVSPSYEEPEHLLPYLQLFDVIGHKELRIAVSTPPQFGKTESTIHAMVRFLLRNPTSRNAYISYSAQRAEHVSIKFSWIAEAAGLVLDGTRKCWMTAEGGHILFGGVGGALTGFPIDGVMVLDDLVKGMADANSPVIRDHITDWLKAVAFTRLHKGASIVAIGTRWHPEDPIGWMVEEAGFEFVNLPAIGSNGESLWPSRWPLDLLLRRQKEVGEYVWLALYMGQPPRRGGNVFKNVTFYKDLPITPSRTVFGIDMAYTKDTSADYSVCLVMVESEGKYYIHDMLRVQVEPPEFKTLVSYKQHENPTASLAVGVAGSEKSSAYYLQELGMELNIQQAVVDKFIRAIPVAAAWNAGDIFVNEKLAELEIFKREVLRFTGLDDKHDDIVDAMSAGYNALHYGAVDWDEIEEAMRQAPKSRI